MLPYLNNAPDASVKITKIETVNPNDLMGSLMLIRIHTDAGIVGHGETYYGPGATAALIHDWMSERLLGADAMAVESHWRFFYERFGNFGIGGAEMRAISAVDVALWDILGQVCNQPIYRLLGGPVRDQVPVYNSCGNPNYGRRPGGKPGWPGYGNLGEPGPLNDSYQLFHDPVGLAQELIEEGHSGMKVWCFDQAAHRSGGMRISLEDLNHAIKPLQKIREAVGDKLEIMIDGHGFFMLPAALRIAEALREIQPLWLEDILKMDNLETLADFRKQSRMPISASEMLLHRPHYQRVLETNAADFIMVDPTWAGGISETVRIAHLAQGYNIPTTMHDCTGPLTLFAGIHVNAAVAGCCYQESVRAHIRSFYKELIDELPVIENGHVALPTRPGLGVKLHDEVFSPDKHGYRISKL